MDRTPEEIFDAIAAEKGLSRYTGDRPRIAELKLLAIKYCEASRRWTQDSYIAPQPFVDITTGSSLNAFAAHRSGVDYIGINKGVEELVRSVFYSLLKLPDVFPEVGHAPESAPPPPWLTLPRNTAYMGEPVEPPEDEERKYLADRLTQYAYEFLVSHEIAHVMRGHVRLKECGQHLDIDEFESSESAPSNDLCILRHTLEMDADSFSTVQGITNIVNWASGTGREAALLRDKYTAVEYWLFSIHCLFRLFVPINITADKLCDNLHPPARVRQFWVIMAGIGLCYTSVCDLDYGRFASLAFDTSEYVDKCIIQVATEDIPVDGIWRSGSSDVDAHLVRLAAKWCAIRPDLVTVSYVSNLTPCTDPAALASLSPEPTEQLTVTEKLDIT